MNVTHVLWGRPWLYGRDVYHCGRENTSHFMCKAKDVTLYPKSTEENEEI